MKAKTFFLIFLGTYILLLTAFALVALTDGGVWYASYAETLLYGGVGIAGFGFLILRGGTAINSASGKTSNVPKTEDYAPR